MLTWHALIAALLPIALRDIPTRLHVFLDHLARAGYKSRPRSVDLFSRHLRHNQAQSG